MCFKVEIIKNTVVVDQQKGQRINTVRSSDCRYFYKHFEGGKGVEANFSRGEIANI